MYFSFYFEKCTFIDIKLKDLFGALVFGKHGLSLTNPPRPGFSSCLVLPPSDYSFRLGTSNNSKLFVSRCTPFIIYFSQNHSSASFFSCFKQRGDYLTSSKIKCFDSQYFKTFMVQIWRIS